MIGTKLVFLCFTANAFLQIPYHSPDLKKVNDVADLQGFDRILAGFDRGWHAVATWEFNKNALHQRKLRTKPCSHICSCSSYASTSGPNWPQLGGDLGVIRGHQKKWKWKKLYFYPKVTPWNLPRLVCASNQCGKGELPGPIFSPLPRLPVQVLPAPPSPEIFNFFDFLPKTAIY